METTKINGPQFADKIAHERGTSLRQRRRLGAQLMTCEHRIGSLERNDRLIVWGFIGFFALVFFVAAAKSDGLLDRLKNAEEKLIAVTKRLDELDKSKPSITSKNWKNEKLSLKRRIIVPAPESKLTVEVKKGDVLIVTSEVNFRCLNNDLLVDTSDKPIKKPRLISSCTDVECPEDVIDKTPGGHYAENATFKGLTESAVSTGIYRAKQNGKATFFAAFSLYDSNADFKFYYCRIQVINLGQPRETE